MKRLFNGDFKYVWKKSVNQVYNNLTFKMKSLEDSNDSALDPV